MPGLPEHSTIDSGKALVFTLIPGQSVESCSYVSRCSFTAQVGTLSFPIFNSKCTISNIPAARTSGKCKLLSLRGSAPLGIHKGCMKIAHLINAYARNKIHTYLHILQIFSGSTDHSGVVGAMLSHVGSKCPKVIYSRYSR